MSFPEPHPSQAYSYFGPVGTSSRTPWNPALPPIDGLQGSQLRGHEYLPDGIHGIDDGIPRWDPKRSHEDDHLGGRKRVKPTYALRIWQQPERARLCSFKEENETIDRRPVDPPPVIEVESLPDSTRHFVRVTIVHPDISIPETFTPVKTPTGADASAGEVIQTPERLRGLDGRSGQLCVFAKLSVRMPGVFRLKFTLYETLENGVTELTSTVSEPFEVFSPKLFKGMRESTALTRHLAAQGLKVKLRTDTTVGRHERRRGTSSTKPVSPAPASLVWRSPSHPISNHAPTVRSSPSSGPSSPSLNRHRFVDDGLPVLRDVARHDWITTPSSDLSAFSLTQAPARRPETSLPFPPSFTSSRADSMSPFPTSSSVSSRPFSPFSFASSLTSLNTRTSSERSERSDPVPSLQSLILRAGDDGIPILPAPFPSAPYPPTRLGPPPFDLPPIRDPVRDPEKH